MIKKSNLILFVGIIVLISGASAAYTCNLQPFNGYYNGTGDTLPSFGYGGQVEYNTICQAAGQGNAKHVQFSEVNNNNVVFSSRTTPGNWSDYTVLSNNAVWVSRFISCAGAPYGTQYGYFYKYPIDYDQCIAGTILPGEVNFTGYPLDGHSPLSVMFTVVNFTSVNTSSPITWAFGDGNITVSDLNPISHFYQNPGTYTVRLDYYNNSGIAEYVQKNNYITVGAPNTTKTKWFQTIDGTNGNIVLNSSIQLQDIENSSWVNATGLINDGMSSITTLEGHHIDAYAQSLGYSDADDLGILNDGQPQYIMMWPTFAKSVSEGNVSLYVTVKDKDTKANIVGAQVAMIPDHGAPQSTATNAAGIAYFVVSNNTMCLISATAQGMGYNAGTTTINTGSGSGGSASAAATILLGKSTTVLPTYTVPTTLPGGGTPVPTVTILPGCEDTISVAGQEKCRAAQSNQGLSFLSGNLLGLIQICFVVTILYLLGIKLGK